MRAPRTETSHVPPKQKRQSTQTWATKRLEAVELSSAMSGGTPDRKRMFTTLDTPPSAKKATKCFQDGFPQHCHQTVYPSGPDEGKPAGWYWVGDPTPKFNRNSRIGDAKFNANTAVKEALATVCLNHEIK